MIKKAHTVVTYLIIMMGMVHIYFARCLEEFDTYTLWFIGSGIAIIFAGLINLIRTKSKENIVYWVCLLTNFLNGGLFIVALKALQDPQVYLGIFLFSSAILLTIKRN